MNSGSLQRFRLVMATVLVTVIVFAAPLVDAAFFSEIEANDLAAEHAGLQAESVLQAGSIDEALEAIEQAVVQDQEELPDWFQAEVGLLPDARDVRVGNAGQVVGYVVDCDLDQALSSFEEHMESLGWKGVPLGQADGFTFIKSSGTCTWALVTCTQIASATSIVIRTQ